jgi:ERCC4-type nuclease
VTPRRIVIDTREQHPLVPVVYRAPSPGLSPAWLELPTVRATLPAGDYSVEGLEAVVAVERKSIADLAGTLYGATQDALGERAGHLERFRRELERLQSYARRWWLIEGSPADLDMHVIDRHRRVRPTDAHALVASIACDYGIPTIWMGDRQRAAHWLGVVLGRIAAQADDQREAAKARGRKLELPWLARSLKEAVEHAAMASRGARA